MKISEPPSNVRVRKNSNSKGLVRLNKFIAECGLASRRQADEWIAAGDVVVNGKKIFELGTKVNPLQDRVIVRKHPVRPVIGKIYLAFHKPKQVVTTMMDPHGRPTIADFIRNIPGRVYPVGRLDWESEGLLLLTNDGDFAQKVSHPENHVAKVYQVKVKGSPSSQALNKLIRGVAIPGGKAKADKIELINLVKAKRDEPVWLKVTLTQGKNRQIRHMFEKIGCDVVKLQRVAIGGLKIGSIKRGEVRYLSPLDIKKIFQKEVGFK